jgi:hypothetical protein
VGQEVVMRSGLCRTAILLALAVAPASAVGDATYTLATYRSMAEPAASPADRFIAVYMASAERAAMLSRLQEKYPFVR